MSENPKETTGAWHRDVLSMLTLIVTVLLAIVVLLCLMASGAVAATPTPAVVAHRGSNGVYTENTRKAFADAMNHGARWLETDVQFTSDGTPVIMHDDTVDRTTNGTGTVAGMTLAKLRTLRTPDGQYVPTLYEFLSDLKAHASVKAFVELKHTPTAAQWAAFDARFTWLGVLGSTVVTSFDGPTLLVAQKHGHTTGWIDGLGDRSATVAKQYGRYYLKHQWAVTYARAKAWEAAGLLVFPWTSDASSDWARFRSDGCSGVLTNKADSYVNWAKTQR